MPESSSAVPRESRWTSFSRRVGGLVTLSTGSVVVAALLIDLMFAHTRAGALAATVLLVSASFWLLADFVRRKCWRVARPGAVAVEVSTLAVVLLFATARLPVVYGLYAGTVTGEVAGQVLRGYGVVVFLACCASLWERSADRLALLSRLELKPVQTVVLSFGLAILVGTLVLSLPFSVTGPEHISVFDALFVATSAVCVTGMSVVDLAATYSLFGQMVILLLVQAGGLGIMFLFAAFAVLSGKRLSVRSERDLGEAAGATGEGGLRRMLLFILVSTFAVEAVGAMLLWPAMQSAGVERPVFQAVFHAVSAYCNAGFTTFSGGLPELGAGAYTLIAALVVIGGLGAPVLAPLMNLALRRRGPMPLHPKLALWTSAALLVGGFTGIVLFESAASLVKPGFFERIGSAMFLSASVRTAGFNLMSFESMSQAGLMWLMMLMLVGASPGSTGGGLKTTTFAVLGLALWAVLRRQDEVTAFGRRVPTEDVLRAFALAWSGLTVLAFGTLVLLAVEDLPPMALLFEAFSAFSTAGMTLGVTPQLSGVGRVVVMVMMFVGRLGPLTLLAAFLDRQSHARVRYPSQHVQFG